MSISDELVLLARKWYDRGEISDSRVLFQAAQETAAALNDDLAHAESSFQLARIAWFQNHPKVAEHLCGKAHLRFLKAGNADRASDARLAQAFMAYDATDLSQATQILDELADNPEIPSAFAGRISGYRGNIARQQGHVEEAMRHYDEGIRLTTEHNDFFEPVFRMDKAILHLLEGDLNASLLLLRQAAKGEERDAHAISFIDHYRTLAMAQLGEPLTETELAPVDDDLGDTVLFLYRTRLFAAAELTTPIDKARAEDKLSALRADCPPTEHARLTLRILSNFLGLSQGNSPRLVVDKPKRSLRHNGLSVTFAENSAEWGILVCLAEAHSSNDHVVSQEELICVGWPNQQLLPKSARNRLHVALSNLRGKGLREILLRHHDGYALSRATEVVTVS